MGKVQVEVGKWGQEENVPGMEWPPKMLHPSLIIPMTFDYGFVKTERKSILSHTLLH